MFPYYRVIRKIQLSRTLILFTAIVIVIVTFLYMCVKISIVSALFPLFHKKNKKIGKVSHPFGFFSPLGHFATGCEANKKRSVSFPKRDFQVDEPFLSLFTFVTAESIELKEMGRLFQIWFEIFKFYFFDIIRIFVPG